MNLLHAIVRSWQIAIWKSGQPLPACTAVFGRVLWCNQRRPPCLIRFGPGIAQATGGNR